MKINIVNSVVLLVFLSPVVIAQSGTEQTEIEETVADNKCPVCQGTDYTWKISQPWFRDHTYSVKKQQRKLVWGTINGVVRNPPDEGAVNVTRETTASVSIGWSSSVSGSIASTIQGKLGIPKVGSIGGEFTATSTWTQSKSGSSTMTITVGRVCPPGRAIWDRGYYYSKEITGAQYQYSSAIRAKYWCKSCLSYTKRDTFTDIYEESNAQFAYPSGEAGLWTPTSVYTTDVDDENHYKDLTPTHLDIDVAKSYKPGSGGSNW
jgi:hypothetical protein